MLNAIFSGLEKVFVAGCEIVSTMAVRSLVHMNRDEAHERLSIMVDEMNEQQLNELDASLLNSTLTFMDIEKRQRATEIYAIFKILEAIKYARFPHFSTAGHALH